MKRIHLFLLIAWMLLFSYTINGLLNPGGAEAVSEISSLAANEEASVVVVVIKEGDTLWQLAEQYGPHRNTADSVYAIKKYNQLSNYTLHPGETISIPKL